MNDIAALMIAAFGGAVCGAWFFGGLWWTIRRGLRSTHPAPWFLGSLLIRTASVVAGFVWVGQGDWKRTLACLLGFLGMRVVAQRVCSPPRSPAHPATGIAR